MLALMQMGIAICIRGSESLIPANAAIINSMKFVCKDDYPIRFPIDRRSI